MCGFQRQRLFRWSGYAGYAIASPRGNVDTDFPYTAIPKRSLIDSEILARSMVAERTAARARRTAARAGSSTRISADSSISRARLLRAWLSGKSERTDDAILRNLLRHRKTLSRLDDTADVAHPTSFAISFIVGSPPSNPKYRRAMRSPRVVSVDIARSIHLESDRASTTAARAFSSDHCDEHRAGTIAGTISEPSTTGSTSAHPGHSGMTSVMAPARTSPAPPRASCRRTRTGAPRGRDSRRPSTRTRPRAVASWRCTGGTRP